MKLNLTLNLSKLILNSQIGRYGMDFFKSTTKLVNRKNSEWKVVKNVIEINDNTFLVTYIPVINKEVVDNIDIIKRRKWSYIFIFSPIPPPRWRDGLDWMVTGYSFLRYS